ncbi:MAG: hypothetical protein DBX67_03770 [Desulfovibrionaceae bacterium]|nr:MAG: hypothetical protein DBX67_03770 [Desulfovibrionaceae bacterium]
MAASVMGAEKLKGMEIVRKNLRNKQKASRNVRGRRIGRRRAVVAKAVNFLHVLWFDTCYLSTH